MQKLKIRKLLKKLNVIFFLVLFSFSVYSQRKNDIIQQRIEFIAEDLELEDISLEDVFDVLYYYYDNPINLNTATSDDLHELLLLSDFQINELLARIRQQGYFESVYQLQEMDNWDLMTIDLVLPFIVVIPPGDEKIKKKGLIQKMRDGNLEVFGRWIRGIEERAGYADVPDSVRLNSNQYYWGSPDRVYSRWRYTYSRTLSMGITMEKDPGEEIFGTTQPYGFDFYSPHFYYQRNDRFVRKIALGDYQMELGQGLAMWTGFAFNKTIEATKVRRNARGVRPYTSVDETRFLRGAAVELGAGPVTLTTFASRKMVNGSVQILDTLEGGEDARFASSINLSGLHRTTGELARKNSITETIAGGNLNFQNNGFQAGISTVYQNYDTPLQRANRPSNQYEFSGTDLINYSVDYSYVYRNFSVFGEGAMSSSSGSIAYVQGLVFAPSKRASFAAVHRNYPKDYHTFYARGFGESARTINEQGTYLGATFKINDAWSFNAYGDVFQTPWLTFRADSPTNGHEFLGQLKYRPNPRLEVFFRAREQRKMQNARNFQGIMRPVEDYYQRVYRMNFNYQVTKTVQWKSRVDYVTDERISTGLQRGFSMAQDIAFKSKNSPLQLTARYAIFDTDGFDARIYAFESHMQNVFSIPVYFNQGSRFYALMKYTFFDGKCDLWLRYAAFVFANQTTIGSGPELIQGSVRSEVGAQVRLRL